MTKSETSPTLVLGVYNSEGLELLEDTTAVEITVGHKDEEVSWILPKSLLTHHSKFLNAALNGEFAESNSKSMTMPEDNPKAFRLFVQWLYVGDIRIDDVEAWLEAWVLGDKIGNTAFRDCAMTKLLNHYGGYVISSMTVATAYRKSVSGSKLRKWALDVFLFHSNQGELHVDAHNWVSVVETETEFVTDVVKATVSRTGGEVKDPRAHLDSYIGE